MAKKEILLPFIACVLVFATYTDFKIIGDLESIQNRQEKMQKELEKKMDIPEIRKIVPSSRRLVEYHPRHSIPLPGYQNTSHSTPSYTAHETHYNHHHEPSYPEESQQQYISPDDMVIDFISVGSVNKKDLILAQQTAFGQHVLVRNFFIVTEEDDFDKNCSTKLTHEDVGNIQSYCKKWGDLQHRKKKPLLAGLMEHSLPEYILDTKANPSGWLCAQKRPIAGFIKAMEYIQTHNQPLPDYLIVLDDDGFVNVDLVANYLSKTYTSSSTPAIIAGCLMPMRLWYNNKFVSNYDIPYGGFGTIFSKGTLEEFLTPIHCKDTSSPAASNQNNHEKAFSKRACRKLKQNDIGENAKFADGKSIVDILHVNTKSHPYTNYKHWSRGSCFHSDWYWGFFANYSSGITPYDGSQYDFSVNPPPRTGICSNDANINCTTTSPICHYVTADHITALTNDLRRVAPHRFKGQ